MKAVSIGYKRDDGNFQIVATLNNNDEIISETEFQELIDAVKDNLDIYYADLEVLEREDAPDYVCVDEEDIFEN